MKVDGRASILCRRAGLVKLANPKGKMEKSASQTRLKCKLGCSKKFWCGTQSGRSCEYQSFVIFMQIDPC